ncbi:MAG: DEAD/DEAH box helicase [Treponema sp.]|jgi:ATP-dependent RNA helicase DeaD|nr:DEAD/DEAH box helicase [Treponema sp.]
MLAALERRGFTVPTSIQAIALPRLLADEGHLIVKARTGTGKTAAFGIPLIEKITKAGRAPRALILAPTRELALQVSREIASLVSNAYPRIVTVYGGASIRNQILDLKRGTEIVVGTPGRVMDLMDRKVLELSAVDWFILDEADEMLDMGFFEDVEKILAVVKNGRQVSPPSPGESGQEALQSGPETQQALPAEGKPPLRISLFSATMPEPILRVIREYIGDVEILKDSAPEDEKPAVDQFCVMIKREDKLEALRRIIDAAERFYGLIFCATKVETDELARRLVEAGYSAEAIHGDLSQEIRERTLRRFRLCRVEGSGASAGAAILAATDVAARGIDIEGLTHVINWDLPHDRESYIHRIGRTGRAGRRGLAISLVTPAERGRVSHLSRNVERSLGSGILWLKAPSVKSVLKSLRRRIVSAVIAALPGQEEAPLSETAPPSPEAPFPETAAAVNAAGEGVPAAGEFEAAGAETASPYLAKVCRQLIERLGAERAVEALVSLSYGRELDPSRYGPVTEFSEEDFREMSNPRFANQRPGRGRGERSHPGAAGRGLSGRKAGLQGSPGRRDRAGRISRGEELADGARVYVGLGRRHGAHARDVAALLARAGGVPGRLVDEIEIKDYCAFATLPADAAKRACVFSRNEPGDPVIRPVTAKKA